MEAGDTLAAPREVKRDARPIDEQVERYEKQVHELQTPGEVPGGGGRPAAPAAHERAPPGHAPRGEARRDPRAARASAMGQNQKLADALRAERERIEALAEEVEKLSQPPASFGVYLAHERRRLGRRVHRGPQDARDARARHRRATRSARASQVVLNESLNVVEVLEPDRAGEVVKVKDRLGDDRVIVRRPRRRGVRRAPGGRAPRRRRSARATTCCSTPAPTSRSSCCPKEEVEELVLEEIPDVSYEDIGGLEGQIELDPRRRRAAVPVRGAVPRAPARGAQGRPALRASRAAARP